MSSKPSRSQPVALSLRLSRLAFEGLFVLTAVIAVYLFIALSTYSVSDPGWSYYGPTLPIQNACGKTGAWLSDILFLVFGYVAYIFPLVFMGRTWLFFLRRDAFDQTDWPGFIIFMIGLIFLILSFSGLASMHIQPKDAGLPEGAGGFLGQRLVESFIAGFGLAGSRLLFFALLLLGMTFATGLSWLKVTEWLGEIVLDRIPRLFSAFGGFCRHRLGKIQIARKEKRLGLERNDSHEDKGFLKRKKDKPSTAKQETAAKGPIATVKDQAVNALSSKAAVSMGEKALSLLGGKSSEDNRKAEERKIPTLSLPAEKAIEPGKRVLKERQTKLFHTNEPLPEITDLLNAPCNKTRGYSPETLEQLSRLLEQKLLDFRVDVKVTDVFPGPVVTRFEVQPKPGTKVSTISNLAKDIARSLAVVSVRVVEVIAGKSVIGIEIPNEDRETVFFSEVVGSRVFDESSSPLTLVLGKDIGGHPVIADLTKMPHLLVAGTTGSGKSVGVNAMLLSLLFKSTAREVRLILVDPKMLELSVYEGIPHLLAPVITDMKDAANGLRWCVGEMERRYKLMSKLGVRNIAGYNRKIRDAAEAGEPIADPLWIPDEQFDAADQSAPVLDTLPFIVIVIDEFADMMMVVGKKVEELIARIAQKARAAGIHLILATQRPSVDVITGLIKANVPTRIAFQVSSKIDSRTILDQGGAEQLLGQGDMLFLPPGTSLLTRVHGAFVDDDEVHRVVAEWKKRGEPDYVEDLTDEGGSMDIPGLAMDREDSGAETDPLYDEAVAFVCETRKASISAVQRKLRIGYNRAARMIEDMEAAGVVSPVSPNGQREVLAPPPV